MPSSTAILPLEFRRPSSRQAAADAIPIQVDGTYHIFHLTTPPDTIHHPPRLRSHWSHLQSRDLIKWYRAPSPALKAGTSAQDHDADGAWTGSAVVGPDGNMHIFYTGYSLSQGGKQVIIHAIASDHQGSSFTKSAKPISISPKTRSNLSVFEDIDFRDPYVLFNDAESKYWMLVATRLSTGPYWARGCLAILTSEDLENWDLESQPFFAPNDMFCPECPELFTLPNGKWYLTYSRFSSPDAGTVYRVSESPRGPFRTPKDGSNGRWDGRRWYAAKSCAKAGDDSKRIYFGWIADRCAADGKWMWGGDMAFPRQVSAAPDGSLKIEPVHEVLEATMSSKPILHVPILSLESIGAKKTHSLDIGGGANPLVPYLMSFKITPRIQTQSFGLLIRTNEDLAGHWLRFNPSPVNGLTDLRLYDITLNVSPPPLDDFWADQYELYLPRGVDGPEIVRHDNVSIHDDDRIQVLLIGQTLEIFAGGRAISYRFLEEDDVLKARRNELGLFVDDGQIEFRDLRILST